MFNNLIVQWFSGNNPIQLPIAFTTVFTWTNGLYLNASGFNTSCDPTQFFFWGSNVSAGILGGGFWAIGI